MTVNKSTVNKINSIKDSDKNKINDLNANKTDYNNDSLNDIGDYINDKCYNVLQDMIKKEISVANSNNLIHINQTIESQKKTLNSYVVN